MSQPRVMADARCHSCNVEYHAVIEVAHAVRLCLDCVRKAERMLREHIAEMDERQEATQARVEREARRILGDDDRKEPRS